MKDRLHDVATPSAPTHLDMGPAREDRRDDVPPVSPWFGHGEFALPVPEGAIAHLGFQALAEAALEGHRGMCFMAGNTLHVTLQLPDGSHTSHKILRDALQRVGQAVSATDSSVPYKESLAFSPSAAQRLGYTVETQTSNDSGVLSLVEPLIE